MLTILFLFILLLYFRETTTEEELIDAFSAAGTVTEFRFFP